MGEGAEFPQAVEPKSAAGGQRGADVARDRRADGGDRALQRP